jgi:hypothetical protein
MELAKKFVRLGLSSPNGARTGILQKSDEFFSIAVEMWNVIGIEMLPSFQHLRSEIANCVLRYALDQMPGQKPAEPPVRKLHVAFLSDRFGTGLINDLDDDTSTVSPP